MKFSEIGTLSQYPVSRNPLLIDPLMQAPVDLFGRPLEAMRTRFAPPIRTQANAQPLERRHRLDRGARDPVIPWWLALDSKAARGLLALISRKGKGLLPVEITALEIADIRGLNLRNVRRAIKLLEAEGLLEVDRRPQRGRKHLPNRYRLANSKVIAFVRKHLETAGQVAIAFAKVAASLKATTFAAAIEAAQGAARAAERAAHAVAAIGWRERHPSENKDIDSLANTQAQSANEGDDMRKGGRNAQASQIIERPPSPAPMVRAIAPSDFAANPALGQALEAMHAAMQARRVKDAQAKAAHMTPIIAAGIGIAKAAKAAAGKLALKRAMDAAKARWPS
jgi:DNA-binding transcriptional ArsR family regulator